MTIKQLLCASALTLDFVRDCSYAGSARPVRAPSRTRNRTRANWKTLKLPSAEGIKAAVRVKPGVLVLYAVSEKDHPTRIRVFEMYTDEDAYKTHLETVRFRKVRDTTNAMVKSRKLIDADPIMLGAKAK